MNLYLILLQSIWMKRKMIFFHNYEHKIKVGFF